jgi:hypothetical protein
MSDKQQQTDDQNIDTSQLQRIFVIGSTRIVEDERLMNLTNDEAKTMLSFAHPEIENANMTTRVDGDNLVVEFLTKPGRKG